MRKKSDTTNRADAAADQPAKPSQTTSPRPKRTGKPPAPGTPEITSADIALRAYFLAEKRLQQGLPGDAHQDWLEAERQLRDEAGPKKNVGKKRPSAG